MHFRSHLLALLILQLKTGQELITWQITKVRFPEFSAMLVLNICCYSQVAFISNIHENWESFRILIPFLLFINNLSQNITIFCPICQWYIYSDILNNSSSGFHFVKLKWACLSRLYLHLTILAFDTNHKHQSIP